MNRCKSCGVQLTNANTYPSKRTWKCKPCHREHTLRNHRDRKARLERQSQKSRKTPPSKYGVAVWVHPNVVKRLDEVKAEHGIDSRAAALDFMLRDALTPPKRGFLSRLFSL